MTMQTKMSSRRCGVSSPSWRGAIRSTGRHCRPSAANARTIVALPPVINLGTIMAALHDSEINGEDSWFFDGVWSVKLGDATHGYEAEAVVASTEEAAE
jgi:hypothetical protein